jgi:flagellar hook-associated protein 3 FlgL
MSGSISAVSPTDYGLMSALVGEENTIKHQLDTLTEQAGDGLVADTYAGLGSGASVSLDLNPEIANLQTWQNNINSITGSMDVTQTTMTQIQQIASNLYSQLISLQGTDGPEVSNIAASAQDALTEVANLLDTTDGNTYVFGGADSTNPPVPDPDNILSSGFYTQIAAAVGNLGNAGASATAAATLAIASSNAAGTSPFSAYISQPAATLQAQIPQVQTGQGQTVGVGLLASANASVVSTGSSTTGSYMRDLLCALGTVGSLTNADQSDPGFVPLIQDTMTSLNGAISAMAEDTGVLGNTQAALNTTQTTLADTQTALTSQVSSVQDVNMASTLSNLSLVETQLQASYQVVATISQLSLAKFLPADS